MKKSTQSALIIGAGAIAALVVARKTGLLGGASEAPGALGGSDDSLTAEGNPFARIDPNYQGPSGNSGYAAPNPITTNPVLYVDPNTATVQQSYVPMGNNPYMTDRAGNTWFFDPQSGQPLGYKDPVNQQSILLNPGFGYDINQGPQPEAGSRWYDNTWAQIGLLGVGSVAVEEGARYGLNKIRGTQSVESPTPSKIKDVMKAPRAADMAQAKVQGTGKYSKVGFGTPELPTGKATVKGNFETPGMTRGQKIAGTAGISLFAAQVADTYIQIHQDYKAQSLGQYAGEAVATGAAVTRDTFSFASGLVYRPEFVNRNYGQNEKVTTGPFATFRDLATLWRGEEDFNTKLTSTLGVKNLFDKFGLNNPVDVRGMDLGRGVGLSKESVQTSSTKLNIPVSTAAPMSASTPAVITAEKITGSSSVNYGSKTLSTGQSAAVTAARVENLQASGLNNAQIINALSAPASKSSSSSSSGSKSTAQQSKSSGTIVGKSSSGKIVVKSNKSKINTKK